MKNEEREIKIGLWKRTREEEFEEDYKRKQPSKKSWRGPERNSPFFVSHNFIYDYLNFPLPPNAEEREYLKGIDDSDYPWTIATKSCLWATLGLPISVFFIPVVMEAYVRPPACNLVLRWQENFCEIRHPQFRLEVRLSHREYQNQHYLGITQLSFFNSDPKKIFVLDHKEVPPNCSIVLHHSKHRRSSEVFACILHDIWSDYQTTSFPDHFNVEFTLVGLLNTARKQVLVEFNPAMCKDCLTLHSSVSPITFTCPTCEHFSYFIE